MNPNQSNTPTPQQNSLDLTQDKARIFCNGDIQKVVISSNKVENQLSLSYESMLKLAVSVLSSDIVKHKFPHAALPADVEFFGADSPYKPYKKAYTERYGEPDQYGKINIVGDLRRGKGPLIWGGNSLVLSFGKTQEAGPESYTLKTEGAVSLHLIVDVMVGFVRDSQTSRLYPQYSAYYLRRWGEDAFEGGKLKDGIPEVLTKDVKLQTDDEEPSILAKAEVAPLLSQFKNVEITPEVQRGQAATSTAPQPSTKELDEFRAKSEQLERDQAQLTARLTEFNKARSEFDAEKKAFQKELKEFQDERSRTTNIFTTTRQSLEKRERTVATREVQAQSQEDATAQKQKILDAKSTGVTHAEDVLRQNRLAIEKREATVAEAQRTLQNEIEAHNRKVELENEALKLRREALDKREQELQEKETKLAEISTQTLLNKEQALNDREAQLTLDLQELSEERAKLDKEKAEFEQERELLAEEHQALDARIRKEEERLAVVEKGINDNMVIAQETERRIGNHLARFMAGAEN